MVGQGALGAGPFGSRGAVSLGTCRYKGSKQVSELLSRVREMSLDLNIFYNGPVTVLRRQGYTLKAGAIQQVCCHDDFGYLQHWDFPDAPGRNALIFSSPVTIRLMSEMNYEGQKKMLRSLEKKYKLPDGFLSLGTVQDLSAMMTAVWCGQKKFRIGRPDMLLRTETTLACGHRLSLCWDPYELYCSYGFSDDEVSRAGGLAIGVVEL